MGRSQADDARNEERSQHMMLYTLTSTPTLDRVLPSSTFHSPAEGCCMYSGIILAMVLQVERSL
jgi:hypothetical protein